VCEVLCWILSCATVSSWHLSHWAAWCPP
jgi:hypothetical protein